MQAGRGRSWQLTGDRPVPWLTYQQIGERFGLGTEAARTRVRRAGWRTQPGNDGRILALVPDDAELRPAGDRASGPAGDRETDRDETALTDLLTGALTALEDAVSERWLGESEQSDKWVPCLIAALLPRSRRDHVETFATQPQPYIQGEGGLGCDQG
jgi:hypothetical protein